MLLAWLKDNSDSSLISSVQNMSGNLSGSDMAIVSAGINDNNNPVSEPRTPLPVLTLSQSFKNCHSFLSLFYRYDRSISRPCRVMIYLGRVTGMSAMLLEMQRMEGIPWMGVKVAMGLACVEMAVYVVSAVLLRLIKTYPEDAISVVSTDSKFNMVQVLKHSPVIKLFDRREDLPAIQPFESIPPLRQPELHLSTVQYIRAGIGLVLTVGVIGGAGVVHGLYREDVEMWGMMFPALAGLDCVVVQSVTVMIQYWAVKDLSSPCLLFSRSLRSLKSPL